MTPSARARLLVIALLGGACTYDFQDFVSNESTGGGTAEAGSSGGGARGGTSGSSTSGGSGSSEGGSSAQGGSASAGASSHAGAGSGGASSATGGKSGSAGAASGGRTSSGGATSSTGGANSSGGGGNKACAGTTLNSICWYLGGANQSCSDVCTSHGGVNAAAEKMVGVPAQGGSVTSCALVLAMLGTRDVPAEATRSDGNGLGCHVLGGRSNTAYWLSSPRFSATAHLSNASIACGCNQ